ncbi:MAG: FkbM family methyltransferase [Saprospiraceae bacterium]|nr:FkbM family methyltransferase [Saprospiraceae bacterium]
MKQLLKHVLRKSGYEVRKYTSNDEHQNLMKLIDSQKINTVLDVGANVGQYSTRLRTLGFSGQIHSFEPLPEAFKELRSVSRSDGKWDIHNYALGSEEQLTMIDRIKNSYSSRKNSIILIMLVVYGLIFYFVRIIFGQNLL